MGSFAGRVSQATDQGAEQARIDQYNQQIDELGSSAPTVNRTFDRTAPEAVAQYKKAVQPVAQMGGISFAPGQTPMMDVYNEDYTRYMNDLNQFNYDKSQFDRNLALDNAQAAANWSNQRQDLINRRDRAQNPIQSGIGGLLGGLVQQVMPMDAVQNQFKTPEQIKFEQLQEYYGANPLAKQQYSAPAQQKPAFATGNVGNYQFGTGGYGRYG